MKSDSFRPVSDTGNWSAGDLAREGTAAGSLQLQSGLGRVNLPGKCPGPAEGETGRPGRFRPGRGNERHGTGPRGVIRS